MVHGMSNLSVSSSHSNNGKSITQSGANLLGFLKPKRSPISILNAANCARTLLVSPESTQIKSPAFAPVASAHLAKSSWS